MWSAVNMIEREQRTPSILWSTVLENNQGGEGRAAAILFASCAFGLQNRKCCKEEKDRSWRSIYTRPSPAPRTSAICRGFWTGGAAHSIISLYVNFGKRPGKTDKIMPCLYDIFELQSRKCGKEEKGRPESSIYTHSSPPTRTFRLIGLVYAARALLLHVILRERFWCFQELRLVTIVDFVGHFSRPLFLLSLIQSLQRCFFKAFQNHASGCQMFWSSRCTPADSHASLTIMFCL